jgi:hypothetical protein
MTNPEIAKNLFIVDLLSSFMLCQVFNDEKCQSLVEDRGCPAGLLSP